MSVKPPLHNLLLHFTSAANVREGRIPLFKRGEGCHLWDESGNRYFDSLAGLFVVQIGHGRADIAKTMSDQAERLAYIPSWSATSPTTIEAAALIADLAPGDLDAVFFVSSGSEAVESAIKFARQYQAAQGYPGRTKVISRVNAYHGTTMGALSATALPEIREPFLPLLPGFSNVPNTLGYTDGIACARPVEDEILRQGPEEVAMVIAEPVQNGGGALVPPPGYWQELRRICDKYGVLLVADEVITSFGRVGTWFGSDLLGVTPDLITFAKGATSGYAPVGGLIVRRPLADRVLDSPAGSFLHGATWGGHPVVMAASLANLNAMQDERVVDNVSRNGEGLRRRLLDLMAAHDVVMEVRGTGYLYALALGRSRAAGDDYTAEESVRVVNHVIPPIALEEGLHLRVDNRGGPKIMISPPLIAGPEEFDEMGEAVSRVLDRLASEI